MKVIAIIQARMGSTRLPGKMTMDLAGKPVIAHVIDQSNKSKKIDEVWLATTVSPKDDVLAKWAVDNNVEHFRGSEDDVLDRYYQTAIQADADVIVRLTGDCPLLDPAIIDQVVNAHLEGSADYTSNIHPPTYPDGLDTEVFDMSVLEKAWKEATLQSEREHVTPYIWKNSNLFPQKNISNSSDLSVHRWTLDTIEDFEFLSRVLSACKEQGVNGEMDKVLEIVNIHPEWKAINSKFERNEGYQKSIDEDKQTQE